MKLKSTAYGFLLLIFALILMSLPVMAQDTAEGTSAQDTSAQETSGEEVTGGQPWDLKNTTQAGLFVFYDMPPDASATGKPVDAGDFDSNGCGDLAITGQNATHPVSGAWRGSVGHVRVVMNVCEFNGQISMDDEPGTGVFTIFGAYDGDMAGTETYVGDFNGDGYDDLLFSAQNANGPGQGRSNAGAAYVLFGSADIGSHSDIDLLNPSPDVLVIHGAGPEDRLGLWVEGGDFDNDGYHDLLLGANQADGPGDSRSNAGEVWIIYGAADMIAAYGQVIDLQNPPPDATWIIGADYDDLLGSCTWGDDLNNDGYDDAIVSASLWRASSGVGGLSFGGADGPGNTRYNAGETFVIFGGSGLRGQTIDLATKLDETGKPVDESITIIYGARSNDLLGEEIAVGDMDGDGQYDLILGTLTGDGPEGNLDEVGEARVIYTHEPFAGQMFDMAGVDPERAIAIYPDQADSKGGDTLRAADINNDGVDDLFYGAPDYNPVGYNRRTRPNAGMLAVIFGQEGGFPHDNGQILIFDPPEGLEIKFIVGGDDNDMMPYAMTIYDMDGDGVVDIIPNAMGGDSVRNAYINAGEIYMISGAEFLSDSHIYQPEVAAGATLEPVLTATPIPTNTPHPEATVGISTYGNPDQGKQYYEETCAGCHGFEGEGIEGMGLALVTSPLVLYAPDDELVTFLQSGRAADHSDNVTGVSMPPSGGRPDWTEFELRDIIAYLRLLRDIYDFKNRQ